MSNEVCSPSVYLQLSNVAAQSGDSFPWRISHTANILLLLRWCSLLSSSCTLSCLLFSGFSPGQSSISYCELRGSFVWYQHQQSQLCQPPHCYSDLTTTPNNLRHHSTITLSCKGYFISFCFSLFSQPQSCLLPCNVTSYIFPVTSFSTVCCRFFLSIWAKQSSHFSFHSTSLT